jgi:hypothetical protein
VADIIFDYPAPFTKNKCHLVAKNIKMLHEFAGKIGLKRCWYHGAKKNHPHYDMDAKYIQAAIENGAVQVDSKELVFFIRTHYK